MGIIGIFAPTIALSITPVPVPAINIETPLSSLSDRPNPEELKGAVSWIQSEYNLKGFYRTIECESNFVYWSFGDWSVAKQKYIAQGLGQFHYDTWLDFTKKMGKDLDYYSPKAQLEVMVWAWQNNLQNHWSCYNNLYGYAP